MRFQAICLLLGVCLAVPAQDEAPSSPGQELQQGWKRADESAAGRIAVEPGTKVPLVLIRGISSKSAAIGDRVYLETAFPIVVDGAIVIPPGSYVAGTITDVKRPGRIKGRAELFIRFDSLTLRNGVHRDFRARVGNLDGQEGELVDKEEGRIRSEGDKAGDARTVAQATVLGTSVGAIAGSAASRRPGMGAGVGAAAGAAAGLVGVLVSRGPEAELTRGSTLEMVLDRPLYFDRSELQFRDDMARPAIIPAPSDSQNQRGGIGSPLPFPF